MTHIVDMTVLSALVSSAARALVLAGAAALALAIFRVQNTSLRLFTWTAVLYGALAMPLLGRLLPPLPIPTPAFLQSTRSQSIAATERPSDALTSAPTVPVATSRRRTVTQSSTLITSVSRSSTAASNGASNTQPP